MSLFTFVLIVVLILFAGLVYLAATALVVDYMFDRTQRLQAQMLESLEADLNDLDQHAAEAPGMQFYSN